MVRLPIQFRIWRRSVPIAWDQTRIVQPTRTALSVAISAINILWQGHGVLRSFSKAPRFVVVGFAAYVITTIAEFLWLLSTGPRFTGFESPTAEKGIRKVEAVDPLAAELSDLPQTVLRDETLEFAKEMKEFEVTTDREFINSLAAQVSNAATESQRDEVLDKQSAELMEHNLRTWRTYREKFYRPARAFRAELRKRLGIRNVNSEPRIPALDQAQFEGARPIAQAADYLAGLARRLK
jgi:hypothetical protein